MSETIDAPAQEAPAAADPAPPPAASAPVDWLAGLPDDLRGLATTKGWKEPADALRSYTGLESLAGRKGLVPPKEGDPPEVAAAYRAALGVPETPDGYKLEAPQGLPDGLWSDDAAKGYAALAHKHGLTPGQAQGLAAEFMAMQAGAIVPPEEQRRAAEETLRQEWPAEATYNRNLDLAKRGVALLGDEFRAYLDESGTGNHPQMVKALARIGETMAEDSPAGMGNGRTTGGDLTAERDRYFTPGTPENAAYTNPLHPGYRAAQDRVKAIFAATS